MPNLGRPELAVADFDKAAAWLDHLQATGEPRNVFISGGLVILDLPFRSDMELLRQEAAEVLKAPHFRAAGQAVEGQKWQEAVGHLDELIKAGPERPGFWILRGRCQAEMGQYDKAAANFARAIDLGNADTDVLVGLGVTRILANDLAGYRRDCRQLLDRHEKTTVVRPSLTRP